MELSIDTSTDFASLALTDGELLLSEWTWRAGRNATVEVMPAIDAMLRQAQHTLAELSAVFVARGPGHFNGLRVGMSIAKGIALAHRLPIVGVSTLEIEALAYAITGKPVCPLLNAGRGDVAMALFQFENGSWKRLHEDQILAPADAAGRLPPDTLLCGEASAIAAIRDHIPGGRRSAIAPGHGLRRAGYLAARARQLLAAGQADDLASLQPQYLRAAAATPPRSG